MLIRVAYQVVGGFEFLIIWAVPPTTTNQAMYVVDNTALVLGLPKTS